VSAKVKKKIELRAKLTNFFQFWHKRRALQTVLKRPKSGIS